MIAGGRVLGLIPARGGSKGLPGKNIRPLLGRPLIAWTIASAAASAAVDDVVVSTDSADIASVARANGAEVPFVRPDDLAADATPSMSVALHALDWMRADGRTYEFLVLLEPTSPLREPGDIDGALAAMVAANATAVVSVCRVESAHPAFLYRKSADGHLTPFAGGGAPRRQDIDPLYFLEGTVYASQVDALRTHCSFHHADTIGYEVPKWKAVEIDDEIDVVIAEAIMRHRGLTS